ncbi:MAG: hypothetical protein EBS08_03840 [Cytophagia bacterium]|nr:hypothetical protein [Cytophagia bacterium]
MASIFRAVLSFLALVFLQGQVVMGSEWKSNADKSPQYGTSSNTTIVSSSYNPSYYGFNRNLGNTPKISLGSFIPVFKLGYATVPYSSLLETKAVLRFVLLFRDLSFFSGFTNDGQYLARFCIWLI